MNIFRQYQGRVHALLEDMAAAGELPSGLDIKRAGVEPPKEAAHGDMSTNAAMVLAKSAGKNPREIGQALAARLCKLQDVEAVDVAGPGFVNFRLKSESWIACLKDILVSGIAYGDCNLGQGEPVNVEYVSANPTGPMHLAHTRGAIVGDSLCNLLEKAGYKVCREYYINDAGNQIEVLTKSVFLRYREALGESIGEIPEGLYPGEYLKDVGAGLKAKYGDSLKGQAESQWFPVVRQFAVDAMMARIKDDLRWLGVNQHVFTSEKEIRDSGTVEKAFAELERHGLVYQGILPPPKSKNAKVDDWEPVELTLLKSAQFGDESDRPLKNSKGQWTYIAPDIAYHFNKFERGFKKLIDVVGADHSGWVPRITAGTKAVTNNQAELKVHLVGLVKLLRNGEPIKMSKRRGAILSIEDIRDEIPAGALRFTMLTRRNNEALDLDLAKAIEQSRDNPVFYVQYAHARCSSVLRHAKEMFPDVGLEGRDLAETDLSKLNSEDEIALIRLMASWPRIVEAAAEAQEPHRIAFYLHDLAAAFHALWNKGKDDATLRFLIESDQDLSRARLALIKGVAILIASGLAIIGVQPVEEMHA